MRKLTVIPGKRDPELVHASRMIQKLVRQGAIIRLEHRALVNCSKYSLRLTQLVTMLSRFRVDRFEILDQEGTRINVGYGTILEELEDQQIVREFALKVVVEASETPGRVAVIDIGQLDERR
ncbi:MAG TPA: hypothetical protein VEC38_14660 [Candidatus Binataceae bacterium]|nr:hypothetical protein [Candidatus Binataceae bacterium]